MNESAYAQQSLLDMLNNKFRCHVEKLPASRFKMEDAEKTIRRQFGVVGFAALPRNNGAAALALGALLTYLYETQKTDLGHIDSLDYYEQGRFMELDLTARRNLELTETLRSKE